MSLKLMQSLPLVLLVATPVISCAFLYLLCGALDLLGGGIVVSYVYAIHVAAFIALMFYPLYILAITAYYIAQKRYNLRLPKIVIFLLPITYSAIILAICYFSEGNKGFGQFAFKIVSEGLSIGYTNLIVYFSANWLLHKLFVGAKS